MKTKTLTGFSFTAVAILALILATRSKPLPKVLEPLQITFCGYTNTSDHSRLAVFNVANTNSCSVAFRVFGPQIKNVEGAWPNYSGGYDQVHFIQPASITQVHVRPPDEGDWRILVAYERGPTAWNRCAMWIRRLESKVGLPQFPSPPSKEELTPPIKIEVLGKK